MSSITINSNIAALNAQRRLGRSTADLRDTFTRLSSGLRINKAVDDAAGLSISANLAVDTRVQQQGIRNLNDTISLLDVAEGALSQLSAITTRQIELAEQAANGTLSVIQRRALDEEANALVNEYNRIVSSSSFNGLNFYDLNNETFQLTAQAGYGEGGKIELELGTSILRTANEVPFVDFAASELNYEESSSTITGAVEAESAAAADFNNDGLLDIAIAADDTDTLHIFLSTSENSIGSDTVFNMGASFSNLTDVAAGDVTGDGVNDIILSDNYGSRLLVGNGNGTFSISSTSFAGTHPTIVDVDGDGDLDVIGTSGANARVHLNNGSGGFSFTDYAAGANYFEAEDVNGDGAKDLVGRGGTRIVTLLGNSDGTFSAAITSDISATAISDFGIGDFNLDGYQDVVIEDGNSITIAHGSANGSFSSAYSLDVGAAVNRLAVGDINNDGLDDVVANAGNGYVAVGQADGTLTLSTANEDRLFFGTGPRETSVADINGDGTLEVFGHSLGGSLSVVYLDNETITTSPRLYLLSQEGAREALDSLKERVSGIASERATIGSLQSRLGSALNVQKATTENYRSATSRIVDADVAHEAAALVRGQILQQSGLAILAQANQSPALALALLGDLS